MEGLLVQRRAGAPDVRVTIRRAFLSVSNLFDRSHVGSVFINGINGEYFEPGLPRSWAAGLWLRWR